MTDPLAGWERILLQARRSLERTGGQLGVAVTLTAPTEQERRIIIAITGVHRRETAGAIRVPLQRVDLFLQRAHGLSLAQAIAQYTGHAVRSRPDERAAEESGRQAAREAAAACIHAAQDWYQEWLQQIETDGTLTRSVRNGPPLAAVVSVLNALPANDMPLPVLASQTMGDTKSLSGTALANLVLRAVAIWHSQPAALTAAQQRDLWDLAGVRVDDLASQVLVLNVAASGEPLGPWLAQAAKAGMPLRLTLHQLTSWPISVAAPQIYVCENPAILRAAAFTLGADCPPLICTEGVPSHACHRLLKDAQGVLFWRNDFDWAGLRLTASAIARYGASPWRMSRDDYLEHLTGNETEPRGAPAVSPWDPPLANEIEARNRAVMEEQMLEALLADLASRR